MKRVEHNTQTFFDNLNSDKKVDENQPWLTSKQAASYLGITPNALRIMVHRAKVQSYKLGSRLRFKVEDLKLLLQKQEE